MSSRKGVGKPSIAGAANSPAKGKDVSATSGPTVNQVSRGMADVSLESAEDGEWVEKKSKNRAGSSAAKSWGAKNSNTKAWGHSDTVQKLGMRPDVGSGKVPASVWPTLGADSKRPAGRGIARPPSTHGGSENSYVAQTNTVHPPPAHGWNWQSRAGSTQSKGSEDLQSKDNNPGDLDDDRDDDIHDDDDDTDTDDSDFDLLSDEYESDSSQKSHETRKKNKWFKKFFETLDGLSVEELTEAGRQWHCPACQGGPGAIDWYRGLQPLMTHAKTKGAKRVKVHRELAELLEEELHRKGTSVIPAGEAFGKWKGLTESAIKDHDIVWPPMVVIMNTRLEKDENEKWIGMGNQELLEYFIAYSPAKARHSYGPQGHRGMSVLIFESSPTGYIAADHLHKHFQEQGTDRDAWDRRPVLFYPGGGGKRQLYGYMATQEDLDFFNRHSQGKTKLKFDMRSYQEMVVNQTKQMSEENQQLIWLKNKVAKEQRHSRALEESFGIVSEKLRKTMEENRIVRERTKMQHEQNKEEMDYQEQFFKNQIKLMHEARDAEESKFERDQQAEREKVKQLNANPASVEDHRCRAEDFEKFLELREKDREDYEAKREKLIETYDADKKAMKQRHWEEELELEKGLDSGLKSLMEKYTHRQEEGTSKQP